jgi:hypothetical protein
MQCPSCAAQNTNETNFCKQCGTKLDQIIESIDYFEGPSTPRSSTGIISRMIGAALLHAPTYEDVEADTSATRQAMSVVVIAGVAAGIATFPSNGINGIFFGVVTGVVGWAIWAYITFLIGTAIFKEPQTNANWGQLARTLGFAQAPGVFKVVGIIPMLGPYLILAISIWQFVCMVTAVRHALDYTSTWRAVAVVLSGAIPYLFILIFLAGLFGTGTPANS